MSNVNLKEYLGAPPVRDRVVADCVTLIEDQVKGKGGLSGVAIRTAYATIKAVKKGFITEVVESMLDEWLERLQRHYDTWSDGARDQRLSDFLVARSDDVAEDLLSVTDRRAETTRHKTAKKAYLKMRGSAKNNVVEAIPDLGRMLERRLEAEAAQP